MILLIGVNSIKKAGNIREYVIGNKDFSTYVIAANIIATWVSGSFFITNILQVYSDGIFYIAPSIVGSIISGILICYYISPRVDLFLGTLSIADAMGNLYGEKVRLITSISSILYCIAKVATQFYIALIILQLFPEFSGFYIILVVAVIIIAYSCRGGIRAIAFMDIVQFFTFSSLIPIIGLIIWQKFDDNKVIYQTISQNLLFDFSRLLDINNPKSWMAFSACVFFSFPSLNPAIFQKILMARDTKQVTNSFFIASIAWIIISMLFIWLAILIFVGNPDQTPNELLFHLINQSNIYHRGFKAILAVGLMSMIMSTADSYINVAATIVSHDLPKALGIKIPAKKMLILLYLNTVIIGGIAFVLAAYTHDLLNVFLIRTNFYAPIILPPLILSILGFRTSSKSIIIGMLAGFFTVLIWYLLGIPILYALTPGIFANIIFLLASHYLLKQSGGFNKYKTNKNRGKHKITKVLTLLRKFSFLGLFDNILPKQEITYIYLGLFLMISIHFDVYYVARSIATKDKYLYHIISYTTVILSAVILLYPFCLLKTKKTKILSALWIFCIFFTLVFSDGLLVIISNYDKYQIIIYMIDLIVLAILCRWHIVLILTITGILASEKFYKYYANVDVLPQGEFAQFNITYYLVVFVVILVFFLRPKQQQQELAEAKNTHLEQLIYDREEELKKLVDLKYEFLRNINHEIHTPMTGITSLGETLWEKYDTLSENQRKQAASVIARSSRRLNSLMNNILDFSKLSSLTYNLQKEDINYSSLIEERVDICKKLYLNNKELDFILDIEEDIIVNCDKY